MRWLVCLVGLLAIAGCGNRSLRALEYRSDKPVREFSRAEQVIDPQKYDYFAEIEVVRKGKMRLDLFEVEAPVAVNSFVFLALNRYYDGLAWHRVIPDYVAQTGDPTGTGAGGPGYSFGLEVSPKLRYDRAGMVGVARTFDPNSNGSQFFITLQPTPILNGQYTIFAEVVEGIDVLGKLAPTEGPQAVDPDKRDKIRSVRILVRNK
ncbi:peptidylprolyl isomerase [Calidithermus chliarophilus]|uniref:peptidylprolyl isomerase n=1 Tax=Calidithermus chliarophilus TaxID=52023 RepID=UPI000488C625|nr:peptidylprolyl isomerase [Calidithermus chliarophilus]